MVLEHRVSPEEEGRKLASILRRSMGLSNTLLKRLKANNGLVLDGVPVHADHPVSAGQLVSADLEMTELPSGIIPEDGPLDILFEDEWFLIVNKPVGLAVHPSRTKNTGTLVNYAAAYLHGSVHAVNRLDRDTSGAVLLAKSAHAKALGIEAMKSAEKEYVGLVFGLFQPEAGVIDLPIARVEEPGSMRRFVSPGGQPSVTHYETLERRGSASLVRFLLDTGRTHQIRVHCAHMGHPILGDRIYGTEASDALSRELGIDRQRLCARRLSFTHPVTGAPVSVYIEAGL